VSARIFARIPRVLTFTLLIALAVGVGVAAPGVSAQESTPAFTDSMPADTAIYFSIRTDDAYIQQLDTFVQAIAARVPGGQVPPNLSISALLDLAVAQLGGDYESTVGAWLGDYLAVGIVPDPTVAGDARGLIVVDLDDRAAAEAFLTNANALGTPETVGSATVYFAAGSYTAFTEDRLLIASAREDLPLDGARADNLAGNAAFNATIDALPAASYNFLAYMTDTATLQALSTGMMGEMGDMGAMGMGMMNVGPFALGGTLLDDTTLALDIVAGSGDIAQMFPGLYDALGEPVDAAFLNYVPAGASGVIHGTNLGGYVNSFLDLIRANPAQFDLAEGDLDVALAQVDAVLNLYLGVTLQEGIIDWLTGDYALWVSYDAVPGQPSLLTQDLYPDQPLTDLGFDLGLVIEATDPARASELVEGIANLLNSQMPGMAVREDIGGVNAVVISAPAGSTTVDLVIASNDNVLVIGTREGATAALSGQGGFNASAGYTAASRSLLPGSYSVAYMDAGLINLVGDVFGVFLAPAIGSIFGEIIAEMGQDSSVTSPEQSDLLAQIVAGQEQVRAFSSIFGPLTISTLIDGTNSIQRWTIALAGQ